MKAKNLFIQQLGQNVLLRNFLFLALLRFRKTFPATRFVARINLAEFLIENELEFILTTCKREMRSEFLEACSPKGLQSGRLEGDPQGDL